MPPHSNTVQHWTLGVLGGSPDRWAELGEAAEGWEAGSSSPHCLPYPLGLLTYSAPF